MSVNKALFAIYVLSDMLFVGLILNIFWEMDFGKRLAGWTIMGISVMSIYTAGALLLNNHTGREVLPLGEPFGPWAPKAPAPEPGDSLRGTAGVDG